MTKMIDKTLKLVCTIGGAVFVTLALPELMYDAAPIAVIMYTVGIVLGGSGIYSFLRG
jgi:hypothetical protein